MLELRNISHLLVMEYSYMTELKSESNLHR